MKKYIINTQKYVCFKFFEFILFIFLYILRNFNGNLVNFREYQKKLNECKREIENFSKNIPKVCCQNIPKENSDVF
jgi:hypothetical protein